jgi:hypothetical protein
MEIEIKPNDVMIIFRPIDVDQGKWDGNYSIAISAVGPLTLSEDDVGKLISSAMMTAACTKLLETDHDLMEKAAKHCEESFGNTEEAIVIPINVYDKNHSLSADTKTVGGVQ